MGDFLSPGKSARTTTTPRASLRPRLHLVLLGTAALLMAGGQPVSAEVSFSWNLIFSNDDPVTGGVDFRNNATIDSPNPSRLTPRSIVPCFGINLHARLRLVYEGDPYVEIGHQGMAPGPYAGSDCAEFKTIIGGK